MKFCTYCGKEIMDEAVICINCGCPTPQRVTQESKDNIINTLSNRITINAVIWIVIGVIQCLAGLLYNWILFIPGFLNIVSSIQDLRYTKVIHGEACKIVQKFEPLTGPIIVLIYNAVIGGFIGVIGSIYYFIAVRGFVMSNKDKFN